MPVGAYYNGHGKTVMADMKARYGAKDGERVFYATAAKHNVSGKKKVRHKRRRNTKT